MGSLGCKLSHIGVCKIAKDKKLPFYIVVEDDVKFVDDQFMEKLMSTVKKVEEFDSNWKILYGGLSSVCISKTFDGFSRVCGGGSTVCMVINHTYYDTLIESEFEEPLEIDSYNYGRMNSGHIYCMTPMIASQKESFSDIICANVNYKHLYGQTQ